MASQERSATQKPSKSISQKAPKASSEIPPIEPYFYLGTASTWLATTFVNSLKIVIFAVFFSQEANSLPHSGAIETPTSDILNPISIDCLIANDIPLSTTQLMFLERNILDLDPNIQDRILAYFERRVGIEVSAQGYMLLFDRIQAQRGEPAHFGSIPEIHAGQVVYPSDAAIYTPRRINTSGDRIDVFYRRVQSLLDSGVRAPYSYEFPLGISPPSPPTRPRLRATLLAWADQDQLLRQKADTTQILMFDARSTDFIRQTVKSSGFPTKEEVGQAGVIAAWLLVQHASSDVAFMEHCLEILGRRQANGAFSPIHYALLRDRVLVLRGKRQRFATQTGRDSDGAFFYSVEDLENLNRIRKTVLLPPISKQRLRRIRWVEPATLQQYDQ